MYFLYSAAQNGLIFALTLCVWLQTSYAITPQNSLQRIPFDALTGPITIDRRVFAQRSDLLRSIAQTRVFLRTEAGRRKLAAFGEQGINVDRMNRSLERFAHVLAVSESHQELLMRLRESFDLYRSTGTDGSGNIHFTGYFRPVYQASLSRSAEFSYPLFRRPPDFASWATPHPTRVMLEGYDGLGGRHTLLRGYELAWVRSRFEAYMIQVQGSAVLEYRDGSRQAIGFAAGTDYPFRGISREFLRKHGISWTRLEEAFRTKPNEMNRVLSNNNRFVFFSAQGSPDPIGNLGVPVLEERSIAVDQFHLPPGALGLIRTGLPRRNEKGKLEMVLTSRFVLNLDSGSAIRGPGRVDIFMGTGEEARKRANHVNGAGQLYYLFGKAT